MPRYPVSVAKDKVVDFCKSAIPKTRTEIAHHLKKEIAGFYPKTHPSRILGQLEHDVLTPLVEEGFLVCYLPNEKVWKKVAGLLKHKARESGKKPPRKLAKAYQTNFLYWGNSAQLPTITRLPKPKKEMNLDLSVFLHRFKKPDNYTWEMLNLLICASDKKKRDDLRIHLYILPFDYNEIELLEEVLGFGGEFKDIKFPFKADVNEGKGFLGELAVG